jgi:hypothetical protein
MMAAERSCYIRIKHTAYQWIGVFEMTVRPFLTLAAFLASLTLAACGGGSGSSLPANGGAGTSQSASQQTQDSIDAANGAGDPVSQFSDYNEATNSPVGASNAVRRNINTAGACSNGVEFYSPDRNGNPDSTERLVFYDNGCQEPAKDVVRIWTSTGSGSETVNRTVTHYPLNSTTANWTRSESVSYTGATFDQYGYPVVRDGFHRVHTGSTSMNGSKSIDGDGELEVLASTGNVSTFCSDSAGFNAIGNAQLGETFGWAGVDPSATRTVNGDGSVTWQSNHQGTAYAGAIGALSIRAGTENTGCPIVTPMFALTGGTALGSWNVPVSATFNEGILTNLTIANATLRNGETLNVQTNQGIAPSNSHFISGTLSNANGTVATFNVDAFGDGTLLVASTGTLYQIDDWHVVT